ncbi:MBL fold metallo-hydrolase [bacterium]|nr:MBL fold metallo-hydrolase [bacterium]
MKVKFWGVRGSLPTPMVSEHIEEKVRYILNGLKQGDEDRSNNHISIDSIKNGTVGGNTSCVEVTAGEEVIIFDAGSGLMPLGMDIIKREPERSRKRFHILLSHTHWDHIMGLPYFAPAYNKGNEILIYSPHPDIQERLELQQDPRFFPISLYQMGAKVEFRILNKEESVRIDNAYIRCMAQSHPGISYAYKLIDAGGKILVYSTDAEYKGMVQENLDDTIRFFHEADALIADAQYTFMDSFEKQDWGHSSSFVVAELAIKAGVKRLFLFHYDPTYRDRKLLEILDQTRNFAADLTDGYVPLSIDLAVEGFEFELSG